ncbi:MAG: ABC transporter ATP-binding protein [Mycobacteriales bacterium]
MPIVIAHVVDVVARRGPDADTDLLVTGGVLLVLLLQNIPTNWLWLPVLSDVLRKVERELREAVADKVQRLSMGVFTRTNSGALQSKALRDTEVVEQVSRQLLMDVPGVLLTLAIAVTVIGIRAPVLLLLMLPAVALSLTSGQLANRAMAQTQTEHRLSVERTASAFEGMFRMLPVTRAHGAEEHELSRLRDRLDQHQVVGRKLDRAIGYFAAVAWVAMQIFSAVCLLLAGAAALHGRFGVSVGDVVLVTAYFGTMMGAVLGLLNQLPTIQRGLESVRSIRELLDEADVEDNDGKPTLLVRDGRLELVDVSVRYDDVPALQDLNVTVAPGEVLAVLGRSGAGKSTLLNVVLGFLRPDTGAVLVDGVDLQSLDARSYRRQIATVPQDVVLFEGSLRDNLVHGLDDVSDERVQEAVVAAGVWEFACDLPDGLDTKVGERGLRLSGGQRQRVAIARALVRDARLLLLDEATSALDSISELVVARGMQRLSSGRTCIIVAHRPATVERADRVLVLDHGRVVALGTPAELRDSPEYQQLIRPAAARA